MPLNPAKDPLPDARAKLPVRLDILACVLFALVLGLYAGLIPLGHWQDEFNTLPSLWTHGFDAYLARNQQWSPRPLSELLLLGYAQAVHRFQSPLMVPALAVLWGVLLAGHAVPIACCAAVRRHRLAWAAASLALALQCLFMLGRPLGEFFYWPQSAVAYLPTTAAIVAAAWVLVLFPMSRRSLSIVAALVCAAALSAEVGAIFAIVLCTAILGTQVGARWRGSAWKLPAAWVMGIPLLVAAGIFGILRASRYGNLAEASGDPAVAHHLVASLVYSARSFMHELLTLDGLALTPRNVAVGVGARVLFFLGAWMLLRRTAWAGRDVRTLALFGASCFVTVFGTIAAAYWQFGLLCCERHGSFRQCLIYIGLLALAAALSQGRQRATVSGAAPASVAAPIAWLLAAVLAAALPTAPKLLQEYASFNRVIETNRTNWLNAMAPGEHLNYLLLPQGPIVGGLTVEPGTYAAVSASGWFVKSIADYFGKKTVTFKLPSEEPGMPLDPVPRLLEQVQAQPRPHCNVDSVNGLPWKGPVKPVNGMLTISGWASPSNHYATGNQTYLALERPGGKPQYFSTTRLDRPDVVAALRRSELQQSGFRATLNLGAGGGPARITVLATGGGRAYACPLEIVVE